MESIKAKMKMPIALDLHMTISILSKKEEMNKGMVLEAGSYVSAQFMQDIQQTNFEDDKGPISKEQLSAIWENVAEFYSESFKDQFTQSDFDTITKKTMQIVMSTNSEKIISDYFDKLMK
jgi:hypothetical protein